MGRLKQPAVIPNHGGGTVEAIYGKGHGMTALWEKPCPPVKVRG